METRWLRPLAATAWVAACAALAIAGQLDQYELHPVQAVGHALLGFGFSITAVLLWNQAGQRGNAVLFAVLAAVWFAGQLASLGLGVLTAPALWVAGFTQLLAGAVLLRYPESALDPASKVFVVVGLVISGVLQAGMILSSGPELWFAPDDAPWPRVWDSGYDVFEHLRYIWWAIAAVIFLVLLGRRWVRLGTLERRALRPILITSVVTAVMIGVRLPQYWLSPAAVNAMEVARAYSAAAVSLAFVLSAVQLRLARGVVADLADDLAQASPTPERVRDSVARALGDPGLELLYWVSDLDCYTDSTGAARSLPEDRLLAPVANHDGEPLAMVLTDPRLERHRGLVHAVMAVSRLALENVQLQTQLRAQLLAVNEARARIVHAGLEERRRLERDLHDGAQQRLLAVNLRLGSIEATTTDESAAAAVRVAREELMLSLGELRDLAHGLYPAVLTQAGVGAALDAVVERLPLPVTLRVPPTRWTPDVESAAYLIVCEALVNAWKHAGPCAIDVSVAEEEGRLRIDVHDDGRGREAVQHPQALRSIRDRLDTLGGQLHVDASADSGTHLVAEFPCA